MFIEVVYCSWVLREKCRNFLDDLGNEYENTGYGTDFRSYTYSLTYDNDGQSRSFIDTVQQSGNTILSSTKNVCNSSSEYLQITINILYLNLSIDILPTTLHL